MKLEDWRKSALKQLTKVYEKEEAKAILKILIEDITGLNAPQQAIHLDMVLTDVQLNQLRTFLQRLLKEEPLQYVLGYAWFYDLKLKVNPQVLIPRRETEELVQWVIDTYQNKAPKILDIGTGSGCIALAIKHHLPKAEVAGWDVSKGALEIAEENAAANKLDILLERKDILKFQDTSNNKWDVIVSNPPYVLDSEKEKMHTNVLAHEPYSALFVEDENSLIFYRAIGSFAFQNLNKGGLLFFEINESKGQETVKLLHKTGFKNILLRKDLQGKDRMICAQKM